MIFLALPQSMLQHHSNSRAVPTVQSLCEPLAKHMVKRCNVQSGAVTQIATGFRGLKTIYHQLRGSGFKNTLRKVASCSLKEPSDSLISVT